MRSSLLLIVFLLACTAGAQPGPRTWRDHGGLGKCNTVSKLGQRVYASYGNGLVWFEEDEVNPTQLNKINGLNDVGIQWLRANPYNQKLLVIYQNSNIDIIDGANNISNYSDLKLKALNGKKYVNEVAFYKQYAYLACGFGIVVFDTEKLETKDTYIIGPGASFIEIYQLAVNDSMIFAATENGLYSINYKNFLPNNFNNWKKETVSLPSSGPFSGVINVEGKILCSYGLSKLPPYVKNSDTLYVRIGNRWRRNDSLSLAGTTIYKMGSTYSHYFYSLGEYGMVARDAHNGAIVNSAVQYGTVSPVYINDVFFDKDYQNHISYWLADNVHGLYQNYIYYEKFTKANYSGMQGPRSAKLDVNLGRLAVAPSYVDNAGIGPGAREGINLLNDGEWSYIKPGDADGKETVDITSVLFDRKDKTVTWAAAWFYGVMKYKNNQPVAVWNTTNTPTMPAILPGEPRCTGLSMDNDGNLWVAHSDRINFLSVIKRNNEFINFRFNRQHFVRKTYADKNGYIWVLHERNGGITVYNSTGFKTPVENENYKSLNKDIGSGNIGNNAVYSIAEDKDGKIWIGTAEGIRVFYNPKSIFSGGDFDAQPIKIVQDGNVELLLGHDIVSCLAVDGANNKWAGTMNGGLYCFSPDGQSQIYHFTAENSPLYSNTILDVSYNETTGDVFIATDLGLQSFRSTIISGSENYNSISAYPNPVKPNYSGTVLIRGLVDKSIVKIADESGNMVWETKSTGGQAEWPVTTLSGARVSSGVYIVYASTTDGALRALTKILVVN